MSFDRNSIDIGPGYIVVGGSTNILSADDIVVTFKAETDPVVVNGYGAVDNRRKNRRAEITFTPLAWTNLGILFPYASYNIGQSIYGATDTPLQIIPANSSRTGYTFANAAVTKMPGAMYSASKKPLGKITFTAIIANAGDPTNMASYWTTNTGNTLPAPTLSQIRTGIYTASWGPLTNFGSEEGFELDTEMQTKPTHIDGYGDVDAVLTSLVASFKCNPVGVTPSALNSALGGAIGSTLITNTLTISNTAGVVATIPNCQLISGQGQWGNDKRSVGPLEFRSVRAANTNGGLAPLWTLN